MSEDWPDRLLKRIEELGLTNAEVCRQAGLKSSTISDIKRGNRPSIDRIAKLARAVNWSLDQLYDSTTGLTKLRT